MDKKSYDTIQESQASLLAQSNASEMDIIKQTIAVNSGTLAITGALITAGGGVSSLVQQVLVTIAICFLAISIAAALYYLTLSHLLFHNAYNAINNLVKTTKLLEPNKQAEYYLSEYKNIRKSTSKVSVFSCLLSLFIGLMLLVVVILLNIW